jgi:hypothetical protein
MVDPLPLEAREIIRRMAVRHSDDQIASVLNRLGSMCIKFYAHPTIPAAPSPTQGGTVAPRSGSPAIGPSVAERFLARHNDRCS